MKTTIPERTVEVCDRCRREGYLQTCEVCGAKFCLTCQGIVGQCWGFTELCRECAHRDDVKELCHFYAKQLTPIFKRRHEALVRLGKRLAKQPKSEEPTP